MNLSQFFSGASLPPGSSVQMPALSNAGANQFVTAANELYVNSATASVVPQSSCNSWLPAALGATNDMAMTTTQSSLYNFQKMSNVLASGCSSGLISNASQQSTHGFYVGSIYYFFSPSDANNPMGWISTTDMVNYTPFVSITPLAGLMIVDVFYNTANSTWYFLEANGTIVSMTNITTFADTTFYSLPMLGVANAYVKLTLINSIWYAIGGSTSGTGYRISSSSNLTAWTTVIENTSATGPAVGICQGYGTGSSTEILVICANDTSLHSTNNGASFTAVTATTGQSAPYMKNVFYSSRTGLYYIASFSSPTVYMTVSTTGTLTTAAWTSYNTGGTVMGGVATGNVNIVDTGTWVGVVYSAFPLTAPVTNFYYGASYNTLSPNLISQIGQLDQTDSYYQGVKAMWLNNGLILTYSSQVISALNSQRTNCMLSVASGATCSAGISTNLFFPNSFLIYLGASTQGLQPYQWSGVAYLSGSYYAAAGTLCNSTSYSYSGYGAFLFKLNSALTTLSCPVAPAITYAGNSTNITAEAYCLSSPSINSTGTGFNWIAYSTTFTYSTVWCPAFVFNGTTFTATFINPTANVGNYGDAFGQYCIANQPASCCTIPKWSSLLNEYVLAIPAYVNSSTAFVTAEVVTMPAITSTVPTPLISITSSSTNNYAQIYSLDVLSTGIVVAMTQAAPNYHTLIVNYGLGNVTLSQVVLSSVNYAAMWEINISGVSYLVYGVEYSGITTINIWKLSITDGPSLVLANYTTTNFNLAPLTTNNLRRVFSYNGSFYLGDTSATSATARNSLTLTPHLGSFTVAPAYLYVGGDFSPANQANTYTGMNTITTVNPTGVPSVFIPAGAAGSFVKVR